MNANDYLEHSWKQADDIIMGSIYNKAIKATGMTKTELKKKYLSRYGISKRNFEAFAEIFTKMELGDPDPLTKAMAEFLEENGWKIK